jgi:hypothetical protein
MFGLFGVSEIFVLLFIAFIIYIIIRIIMRIFGFGRGAKERKRQTEILEKISKNLDNE